MPRVTDEVLEEIIDNDGCRRGSLESLNATGVLRLALDLYDARAEVRRLRALVAQAGGVITDVAGALEREAGVLDQKSRRKRTKKKT